MKFHIRYILPIVMLAFLGCQSDDATLAPSSGGQVVSVSAPAESLSSRAEIVAGESSIAVSWAEGDSFTVYSSGGARYDFDYYASQGDGAAKFVAADGLSPLVEGESYTAIYPSVDGVATLDEHRAALSARLEVQTQSGNSDCAHLNDALRMESDFIYDGEGGGAISFSHSMATMSLNFTTEGGALPTKLEFKDGDYASYSVNFEDATSALSYTAYYVITPNDGGERMLHLTVKTSDGKEQYFAVSSSVEYLAGRCYTAEFEPEVVSASDKYLLSLLNVDMPQYDNPLMDVSDYNQMAISASELPITLSETTVDLIAEYNLASGDDITDALQAAMDKHTALGGANIYISAGDYPLRACNVSSNIHLLIDKDVILRPYSTSTTSLGTIIGVGTNNDVESIVNNVSVIGVGGGRFKVILDESYNSVKWKFVFINTKYASSFLYANFDIYDHQTKMASLTYTPADLPDVITDDSFFGPTDGVLMNVSVVDAHYGYGLVQTQAGQNLRFYNLHGIGGLTLRLETGLQEMNEAQFGGVFDIEGHNISVANGHGAVMCGPHGMTNGVCHFSKVTAYSSGSGFSLGESEEDDNDDNNAGYAGSFGDGSSVKEVTAYFGFDAQIKTKQLGYIPWEYRDKIWGQDPNSTAVYNHAPSYSCVKIATQKEIIYDESTFVVKTIDGFDTSLEFCVPISIGGIKDDSDEVEAHEKAMKAYLSEKSEL